VRLRLSIADQIDVLAEQNSNQGTGGGIIEVDGYPTVDRVVIDQVPTAGLGNASHPPVTVLGREFGRYSDDTTEVLVGSKPATGFKWISSSELAISIPPGVGASVPVQVRTRGGVLSTAGSPSTLIQYNQAEIESTDPPYILSGEHSLNITLFGTDFGNMPSQLDWIEIAGKPCYASTWISPTEVVCTWIQTQN